MLQSLFRKPSATRAADRLYAACAAQARNPLFYTALGVEDRIDARFELYTLHVLLLVMRLKDEPGERGPDEAQRLFDVYVSALDHLLRELGVGDLSVAKKMRKLAEQVYGRMSAYEAPLRADDRDDLALHLARNVHACDDAERGRALADYALAARAALAAQTLDAVIAAPAWAEVQPGTKP